MKKIKLTQGQEAKVDDHLFEYLNQWKWQARFDKHINGFYAVRRVHKSGIIIMHRLIMNTPAGLVCDHINKDTLDNRVQNLRNCTNRENIRNSAAKKNNKTGYKGVSILPNKKNRYRALITVNGNTIHIGVFETAKEAAIKYDEMAKKLFGEFAFLNFP